MGAASIYIGNVKGMKLEAALSMYRRKVEIRLKYGTLRVESPDHC